MRKYAWFAAGEVRSGTLTDYANDHRSARRYDEQISDYLWNGLEGPTDYIIPMIEQSDWDYEGIAFVTIRVQLDAAGNEDVAHYSINGNV